MTENKNINIAMTFYGGVSLAVYEAGVAEEFIRFIQFCKEKKDTFKIPDVNIKVISGTSAGGLAAVTASATLANSKDPKKHIEEMRRIWFDTADISKIQYETGKEVKSLLDNDILEEKVKTFLDIKGEEGMCGDVKIILTCTNMQGYFDAIPVENNFAKTDKYAERAIPTIRHTEVFKFDWKEIKDNVGENNNWREKMAKAARVTSSFPAAFPPQYVQSPSFSEDTFKLIKEDPETNKEYRDKPLHFWYFDGGVLDNKPLGHAIDHMESCNDGGEWWFFFVEPDPDEEKKDFVERNKKWSTDERNPPDPAKTVLTFLSVRGAETIYYDLRRIQKMNHQIQQVNSLLADIWGMLSECDIHAQDEAIKKLEDNIITARLHRFLPDYLKCATMVRYNFLREGSSGQMREWDKDRLHERHVNIVATLRYLLDLRKIIEKSCEKEEFKILVSEGKIDDIQRMLAYRETDIKNGNDKKDPRFSLLKYDRTVKEIKKAQDRFRQIAFWVEDDYQKHNHLSQKTMEVLKKAMDDLEEAMKSLEADFNNVMTAVKGITGEELIRKVTLYVRLSEALHASAGLETRERINVARIYHNKEKNGSLAGASLGHFGGFLDKRWRMNDYSVGIKDAREMLEGRLKKDIFSSLFWTNYCQWRHEVDSNISPEYRLPQDNLSQDELSPYNLPASKHIPQIDGLLKTTNRLIKKYGDDKPIFKQLKAFKFNLFITLTRMFLWLVKQATAKPANGKDVSSMKDYMEGKRFIGFTGIGIIIGLAASFFMPDMTTQNKVLVFSAIAFLITWASTTSIIKRLAITCLIAAVLLYFGIDVVRGFGSYLYNKLLLCCN